MSEVIGIIGLGSAGQRHARNALAMGLPVVGYEKRTDVVPALQGLAMDVHFVDSVHALCDYKPLGVIIATPPETHAACAAIPMARGCRLLIEKPLETTVAGAGCIVGSDFNYRPIAVGYQFRHAASIRALKADVNAGKLGRIVGGVFHFASKAWASKTYPADFLLEVSHEFDLARYFLGNPESLLAVRDARDVYHVSMMFPSCCLSVSLDGQADGYKRFAVLYGSEKSDGWYFDQAENDQAYRDELADFVRVCRGEKQPECTADDGLWALRIVDAIKKSAGSGVWERC